MNFYTDNWKFLVAAEKKGEKKTQTNPQQKQTKTQQKPNQKQIKRNAKTHGEAMKQNKRLKKNPECD